MTTRPLLRLPQKASGILSLVPWKHFQILQSRWSSQLIQIKTFRKTCSGEILSSFFNRHIISISNSACSIVNIRFAHSSLSWHHALDPANDLKDKNNGESSQTAKYILRSPTLTEFRNKCRGQKFEMKERDWQKFEEDILRENPNAERSLESTIMQLVFFSRDMNLSESFVGYIRGKGRPLKLATLAIFVAMCGICSGKEKQDLLFAAYDEMLEISDVFDNITTRLLVQGFSKTDRWRECLNFLEMTKLSKTPTSAFYSPIVAAAFREGDWKLGQSLLDHMGEEGLVPSAATLQDLVKLCGVPESGIKFQTLMGYLQKYHWTIDEVTAHLVQEYFLGCADKKFTANFTSVTDRGICLSCNHQLRALRMADKDFEVLRHQLLHSVLIGDNVYLQSLPEEVKHFTTFVQNNAPFDIVIDSLNIIHQHVAGNFKVKNQMNLLRKVIEHFAIKQNQRVLVIGRKYMKKRMKSTIERIAKIFYTEDVSHDDLFVLYAALYSGKSCLILSQDQMRDHKFKLGPHLKEMFELWQRLHQIPGCFPNSRGGLEVQMPIGHETGPQEDVNGWHIPYEDGSERAAYQRSNTWLCVRDHGGKL